MFKKILITTLIISATFASSANVYADDSEASSSLNTTALVIDINSENLKYIEDKEVFEATGSPEVVIDAENSRLEADKLIFNQKKQTLTAEKNVRIYKNNQVLRGDFAIIDLTKDSMLINNPTTKINCINISANSAEIYNDNMKALNGNAVMKGSDAALSLTTRRIQLLTPEMLGLKKQATANKVSSYRITTKKATIKIYEKRNVVTLKQADIWVGKHKVLTIPSLELSTDKDNQSIETNLPEIGNTQELGTYMGYGHVFYMPNGATLKLAPLFALDGFDNMGFGGVGRFISKTNRTEVFYSSVKDKFVVNGEQKLFPNTRLLYGRNAYVMDGFFGERKAKNLIEAVNETSYRLDDINMNMTLRPSIGYAEDYDNGWGTMRAKLQSSFMNQKPLWNYKDYLSLGTLAQFDATVYGNGNTFALAQIGPSLTSSMGPLFVSSTYLQGGVHGQSPMLFDRYQYGKSNLQLYSKLNLTKYADISYLGYFNLTKDNWLGKLLTENQITFRVGAPDFKFTFAYDTVRKRATFGVDLALGSEETNVSFKELEVVDVKKQKTKKDNENRV